MEDRELEPPRRGEATGEEEGDRSIVAPREETKPVRPIRGEVVVLSRSGELVSRKGEPLSLLLPKGDRSLLPRGELMSRLPSELPPSDDPVVLVR